MANKPYLVPVALMLAAAVGGTAWFSCRSAQPGRLILRFHPFVGEQVSTSAELVEPESYHLARFDNDEGTHVIVIENVPHAEYGRIEFGIGVDPMANGTIAATGELDPNGRMAWSWDVGYKFVLFEGGLVLGDTQYPLVYHVGFDENYKQVSLELDVSLFDDPDARLELRTDVLQMFNGVQTVDMAALPNVKFDRTDARLLADNYARMLSVCGSDCAR